MKPISDKLAEKLNLLADLVQQREQSDGAEYAKLVTRIRFIKSEVKKLRQQIAGEVKQEELF